MSHHVLQGPFDQFAYKSDPPPPPQPTRAPTDSVHLVPSPPAAHHLPDSHLTRLSKCIACGLQWTSRKTAKQKRTHVELCAKKNGLTRDTIRTLVEKDIDTLSPPIPAHGQHENATVTLLDSVVSTGPAKKTKRRQVVSTVRSLPETRESILDKAKDILGRANDHAGLQPTQQFARSALARQTTQQPKCSTSRDADGTTNSDPSPTRPFGASSLRAVTTAEQPDDECEESPFPLTQQFGASVFAQDSHKRPASPSLPDRSVRRRLLH